LTALVQNWSNDSTANSTLVLVLRTSEAFTSDHERFFWSSDCTDPECAGKTPKLSIDYRAPTATPTATHTSLPTQTPTSTPGVKSIVLSNAPLGTLEAGANVRYTIDIENGEFDLTDVKVSNVLPVGMEMIDESNQMPESWMHERQGRTLFWEPPNQGLTKRENVSISYAAQRHTPTATNTPTDTPTSTPTNAVTATPTKTSTLPATTIPTATAAATAANTPTPTATPTLQRNALMIVKTAPTAVDYGTNITYIITVTNQSDRLLSNLIIHDLVPADTQVSNDGDGTVTTAPFSTIQWQVQELAAGAFVTRTFAVRLLATVPRVDNRVYFVDVMDNDRLLRIFGQESVTTAINYPPSIDGLVSSAPTARSVEDGSVITNEGAQITWKFGVTVTITNSNPAINGYLNYMPVITSE
ncbi:MAG TPA: hypothetical protein P5121_38660, partial [Caldilineaceae bacterium]|nr:hypothetical protein [Caldilineaceae bacterium]